MQLAQKSLHRLMPALGLRALAGWLLVSLCLTSETNAAGFSLFSRKPDGPAIYKQQCAKCHGPAGQGVKGKYNDPLVGDWSVEKLTRYIAKTMPEDKPGSCTGPHADAVARYVHDTFYSREARAKTQTARVELVRLTNRQHLLSVADLFRAPGDEPKVTAGKGLQAAGYKSARGTRREDRALDRTDRKIEFDFGTNRPQWAGEGTNGFALHWSGSIIADETGEHEFVVKAANGIRLWVNDEDKPLIDGSVSSAKGIEHRASIRLIGGRAYPIRLEFFKAARDKNASVALLWQPPHSALQVIPARNLAPERAATTFISNTPFPADDSSVGYERGVSVSKEWDEAVTHAAIEVATHTAKNLDRLTRSKASDKDRAAKVEAFCAELVAKAFRRPLTGEQKNLFVTLPLRSAAKLEDGVKRVVLLTLKSPRFLYLGLEGTQPDDFTIAERLSFGLWDSLPDTALMKAAAEGKLRTHEQVTEQARRMLGDARTRGKMQYFLHRWLQMNHIEDLAKDQNLFPGFTPEIISDLRTSLNLFLEDVVWTESSDYRRLVLEDDFFVNGRLAKFYGVSTDATEDFVRVQLDPKQRSGVITHPYLLAAFSYNKSSSPIHRGVFLTRNIVGRALRPPPIAVAFKDADFKPGMTMREKITELTRPQACHSCHSVINPLGFALENFDAVGRFRDKDGNRPVDTAADYTKDDGGIVRLKGARDVAEFAVNSEHAHHAFIEQLFNQVVKQPMLAYGPDVLNQLRLSFVQSGYNIQKLLVDIVTVSALQEPGKPASTTKKKT
jgi:mono/diheme cytochrome c family protein